MVEWDTFRQIQHEDDDIDTESTIIDIDEWTSKLHRAIKEATKEIPEEAGLGAADSKLLHLDKLLALYFHASWSPQCKQVDDLLPDLVKDEDLERTNFCKVDAEQVEDVSLKYKVTSVPTFVILLVGLNEKCCLT
ncbi:glutaredoxin 3-like [Dermacentor silvarum]|uniref:glutaredoxin 3-like n=1 Tax=Dermacentor silvarum TaxID=543639 RepID=UPI0021008DC7|nr:glutaredoxin 3-like [Dermacentor silvarum]